MRGDDVIFMTKSDVSAAVASRDAVLIIRQAESNSFCFQWLHLGDPRT
jgi:hypothetical protein